MLYLVYAVLGVCCTWCILYSVYVVLGVCCTRCRLYSVYAVLGVCCTRCMLYSVYGVLGVCCTRCYLLIMAWRDREGWLNFMYLGGGRVADEKERDEWRWGKSSSETGTSENFVHNSIHHPWYCRYKFRSGLPGHRYTVFPTQSGKWQPWFLVSARILHSRLIFIFQLTHFCPQLNYHRKTQHQQNVIMSLGASGNH